MQIALSSPPTVPTGKLNSESGVRTTGVKATLPLFRCRKKTFLAMVLRHLHVLTVSALGLVGMSDLCGMWTNFRTMFSCCNRICCVDHVHCPKESTTQAPRLS